ncbi:serine hydrolase domain-containing protein [Neobacillus sp. D3-1R]|uniref:serine hydrolase domain-containing protein n=1 Tax=Neobacillus sp. D3-1R TaxID=3445778 RepID=UPI003FA16844
MLKKGFMVFGIALVLLVVGFVAMFVFSSSFNPNKYEGSTSEKIAQYMDDKGETFQGTVLVTKGEDTIFEESYGWADKKKKIKNDVQTQYQIGSITKSFTSAAILMLEEEGKLKTSDTIDQYLPKFPRGNEITIHQLLTHTSGIYNYTSGNFNQKKKVSPEEIVHWFENEELDFEPGKKFSYSNSNYILLGLIIEKVSGIPYEQFLEKNILKPVNLNMTTANRNEAEGLAVGYKGTKKDTLMDNSIPYAAGMLISTVGDLDAYIKAIHKGNLLNEESQKELFRPEKEDYAYGWMNKEVLGERVHMHNGGINGFRSIMEYYPEKDYTVIVLSNNVMTNVDSMALDLSAILLNKKVNVFNRY